MIQINNKNLCEKCFMPLDKGVKTCPHCGTAKNTDRFHMALPEGTILLGKYVVGKVLGKGGFGITYLCYDSKSDKRVAIKEYLPDSLTHRNTGEKQVSTYGGEKEEYFLAGAQKFYEEAKIVSRFNGNPNIISVYEFFYENNTAYFVMEYLDGIDLKKYISQNGGKLSENQVAFIADRMCDALIVVHSMGILHRDISPDNIFVCRDGNIKLIDFGAARQVMGEASKSLSVILKQGFAPLEQYQKHGNQGPWTDLYALGACLYYSITGKVIDDAMTRISDETLDITGISPEFTEVMQALLIVDIKRRCQSAIELKQMLKQTGIDAEPLEIKENSIPENKQETTQTAEELKSKINTIQTDNSVTGQIKIINSNDSEDKKGIFSKLSQLPKSVKIAVATVLVICIVVGVVGAVGPKMKKENVPLPVGNTSSTIDSAGEYVTSMTTVGENTDETTIASTSKASATTKNTTEKINSPIVNSEKSVKTTKKSANTTKKSVKTTKKSVATTKKTTKLTYPSGIPSNSYFAKYYDKYFRNGIYSVYFSAKVDGDTTQIYAYRNGKNWTIRVRQSSVEMTVIYGNHVYLCIPKNALYDIGVSYSDMETMGITSGAYIDITQKNYGDFADIYDMVDEFKQMFTVDSYKFISRKNVTKSGKNYVCEEYSIPDGTLNYYFSGNDIALYADYDLIDLIISNSVPSGIFSIPSGYKNLTSYY